MFKIEYKHYNDIGPVYVLSGELDEFVNNTIELKEMLKQPPFTSTLYKPIVTKVNIMSDLAFQDRAPCVWSGKGIHIIAEWKNWNSVFPVCMIEIAVKAYCHC